MTKIHEVTWHLRLQGKVLGLYNAICGVRGGVLMRGRFICVLSLCISTISGRLASAAEEHIFHYDSKMGFMSYSVDVTVGPGPPYAWHLRIYCVEKCSGEYSEDIDTGAPFSFLDNGDEVATLWAAGSANWLKIYHLSGGKIYKVLDEPTRMIPIFTHTDDGRREVIVRNDSPGEYVNPMHPHPTHEDIGKIRRRLTQTFVWNGVTYVRQDEKP